MNKPNKLSLSDIFSGSKKTASDKCKKILAAAKKKLGKRYVWGASGTKNTYDCSSFTKYVYKKNGIAIPRTSINQSKYGKYVKRKDLKKGDLIFFDTSKRRKGYVNHVGIYLGDNKFIHASSAKKKVVITSLNKNFYSKRYKGARRPS
jgi:cell wall-associated NlpC family hydrolase